MDIKEETFLKILANHARRHPVSMHDFIFRGGLDMSSIRFTEFILELEETLGIEIDVESIDASIRTVGQLFQCIESRSQASPPMQRNAECNELRRDLGDMSE